MSNPERGWRAKAEAIRQVFADWNPLGVPPELPRDEYCAYVFRVHRLLLDEATTEKLWSSARLPPSRRSFASSRNG